MIQQELLKLRVLLSILNPILWIMVVIQQKMLLVVFLSVFLEIFSIQQKYSIHQEQNDQDVMDPMGKPIHTKQARDKMENLILSLVPLPKQNKELIVLIL